MSFNAGAKTSLLQYPTSNRICGDSTRRRMMMRSGLRPSKLPVDSARSLPCTSTQRPQTMPPSHGGSSYHQFHSDHATRTLDRAEMTPKAASFGPPARSVHSSSSTYTPTSQSTNPQVDARSNQLYQHTAQSMERPVSRQSQPTQPRSIHQNSQHRNIGRQRSEPILVPKSGTCATQSGAHTSQPARKREAVVASSLHNPAHGSPKKVIVDYDEDVIIMDENDIGKNSLLDTENSSIDDWDDASETLNSFRDANGIRERAKLIRTMSKQLHLPKAVDVSGTPPVPTRAPQQQHLRNDMIPLLATRISTPEHEYASDEEEF
ncbi:hypothetical protein H310_04682 [Aphanomyces invadans]|uniref:Uncharacterized protein n=1 Tax=Aphanomyces invadans TaxID=157072 RepID=A0A024UDZ9_9STRA|nr:hypothetical protein H310_04682 [Aphanomyces invadans]ETW04400.1 hypothetical protein H310_04682 [Aphanomyces invadans]|eukprot:XP_008867356.1 hypothetical protein H310_04682 [Aphanomyces invadans]